MPIKSQAQWGFLAVKHPELLKKWQKEAHRVYSRLPKRIAPKKATKKIKP